jgi:hypothetical protein
MSLDTIIDPEVRVNTPSYEAIINVIQKVPTIRTILEIGASSGDGSTEALIKGVLYSGRDVRLASIEVSRGRHQNLSRRYQQFSWFHPYNVSSLPISSFPSKQEVRDTIPRCKVFAGTSPDTIIGWYDNDIQYVNEQQISQHGIEQIKKEFGVDVFDMCMIDGSEFLGNKEFEVLQGSQVYVLDDIYAYKNHFSHLHMLSNPSYKLYSLEENRGGTSIFVRTDLFNQYLI